MRVIDNRTELLKGPNSTTSTVAGIFYANQGGKGLMFIGSPDHLGKIILEKHSTFTMNQEAQLKAEIKAQKAKNAELTNAIAVLEEVKAKYRKFPAEFRVLPEKEPVWWLFQCLCQELF